MAPATLEQLSSGNSFSEKHKQNLMKRRDYFSKNLKFTRDVLNRLTTRGIFGEDKKQLILKCTCDEDMSLEILDQLITGKTQDFAILLEILLWTHQRILANILYQTLPREECSELPMPELKSRKIPVFKQIPSSEVIFTVPHGAKERFHQIGAGAFSVVQLATYTAIDAKVAFKRVKGSEYGGISDKDIRCFMKEASTMYAVRHPDIVSIYGTTCDTKEHIYGMVMEFMEVGSLSDLMTRIEIPWPVKVRMLSEVCRGLRFLSTPQHDRLYPVTHCDIKAQNVLINDKFSAKVADFGQAMLQNITMKTMTSTSSSRGTITHTAPELLDPPDDNYEPTEMSDIWSFGITVFEICAENAGEAEDRTPFPRKMKDLHIIKTIGTKMQTPFNELQMKKIPDDCPPFLIHLFRKCCQVQGDERLNFTEAAKLLEEHYIGGFKNDIHQAMCQVHRRYGEKVLGLNFSDSDAKELAGVSLDKKLNEIKHQLAQHITHEVSRLGGYDDNYEFDNSLIQKNYESLVEGIYPDDVLDCLYGSMVISRDDYERVRSQTTTRDKNRLLLIMLDRRGEEGVAALREALATTPQKHLAGLLLQKSAPKL